MNNMQPTKRTTLLHEARSLLFVPGNRPERFAKALGAGADLVCVDLEDAVPPSERPAARLALLSFLQALPPGHRCGVRISRLTQADGLRDLLALHDGGVQLPDAARSVIPAFVMLAKTESAVEVQIAAAHLPGVPLMALLENARGLQSASTIASAHPQLQALMFGGADLAADLGCSFTWEPLLHARCTLVAAAAAAGLAAFDVPWLDVADPSGARGEASRAAALGFTAKALIHPAQVDPVHLGLAPAEHALASARRIVAACTSDDAAVLLDGRLVDRPVVLAAQRLLRRAGA